MNRMDGCRPEIILCTGLAIRKTSVDFCVLEGVRTKKRQKKLYKAGATKTMNSRHLTGHAVDLGAWVGGDVRWDWPLYDEIAKAMKWAAKQLKIKIVWGGDWPTFKDGPHFELSWDQYPLITATAL